MLNRYGSSVNWALIHANRLAFGRTKVYLCMTLKSRQPACRQSCLETPCVARRQNIKHNTYPTMMKKLKYSPSSSDGSRSVSYRSRINPVLFPYRPSFFLLSSFFRCSIILASRSGNNTERIRKPCGIDTETIGGTKKKQGRRKEERRVRTSYSEWFHSPVFRWRRSPLCSTLLPHHRAYLHGIYLFAQKSL